jgi:hypothetical protein
MELLILFPVFSPTFVDETLPLSSTFNLLLLLLPLFPLLLFYCRS